MLDDRPPLPSPTRRPRWLAPAVGVLAAVVVVVGVIVAVQDDSDDELRTSPASSTTSLAVGEVPADAGDAANVDAADGEPSTTSTALPPSTSSPATTVVPSAPAPGEDDLGAARDPGPTSPPRPGKYRYHTSTQSDSGSSESDSTTTIAEESRDGDTVVQRVDGKIGEADASSLVKWTSSEVLLQETTFKFNGQDAYCDWQPDHIEGKLPLAEGVEWSSTSKCSVSGFGPQPVIVTRTSTGKVTGLDRRRIAGEVLDLWVVQATDHVEFSTVVIDGTAKKWFSPKHGLFVRVEGSGSGSSGDQSGEASYQSELQNLEPE